MAMDRTDITGLGLAIGGHAILLGVIIFGLFTSEEEIEKPQSIAVTLEGEGSPAPVTGDFGEEEPAPSEFEEDEPSDQSDAPDSPEIEDNSAEIAQAESAKSEAAAAEAEAKHAAAAAQKANATAAEKARAKKAAEAAAKKKRTAEAARKKKAAAEAKRKKAAAERKRKAEAERKRKAKAAAAAKAKAERDKLLANAVGGNASATSGQARSKASASIGSEVRPFLSRCGTSTGDSSSLRVFVSLVISKSAALQSANIYNVKGITPANRAQVDPVKRCVVQALKKASPYNLNSADYNVWKNHKVQLKVNF